MTCIYVRYNNLKRTGQFRNVWVEFGFGTVCLQTVPFNQHRLNSTQWDWGPPGLDSLQVYILYSIFSIFYILYSPQVYIPSGQILSCKHLIWRKWDEMGRNGAKWERYFPSRFTWTKLICHKKVFKLEYQRADTLIQKCFELTPCFGKPWLCWKCSFPQRLRNTDFPCGSHSHWVTQQGQV